MTTEIPENLPADIEIAVSGINVPEGPAWGPDEGLYFVSAGDGGVHRLANDGSTKMVANTQGRPNGLAFSSDGILHVADAGRKAILRVSDDGNIEEFVSKHESREFGGPNDLCFLPNGDLLFTDPARVPAPDPAISPIYSVTSDGETGIFAGDLAYPNGVDLMANQNGVYVAEMRAHRLVSYEFDANGNALAEKLVRRFREPASPDGMSVDVEGRVFQSLPGINSLALVGPEGDLAELYYSPRWKPSNVSFGGADLKTVYVTSESDGAIYSFRHSCAGVDLLNPTSG